MREETQVCIVGGGLIGMLCAYEASKAGLGVFLIDKNFAGRGDNAASVLFAHGENVALNELLTAGHQGWIDMQNELETPLGYHQKGVGLVALTQDEAQNYATQVGEGDVFFNIAEDITKALGVHQIQEDLCGLLFEEKGAHIHANQLHEALRQELIRRGVRVWGSDRVAEIIMRDGAVTGVKTTHDELVAEHTILCSGAWTGKLMAQLGLKLPLRPARNHSLELSVTGETPDFPIVYRLPQGDIILRPLRNGRVLVSYSGLMDQEQATWRQDVDYDTVKFILQTIAKILPAYHHGKTSKTEITTLAVTPDILPFIGRVAAVDGLYVATGMNASTFAFAPAVAKALVALIQKEQPTLNLEAFSPDRYIHLHQKENSFAEQEAIIRETFGNLDTEQLEKKIIQAKENHEKAKAEANKTFVGKELKDNKEKVQHAKLEKNFK